LSGGGAPLAGTAAPFAVSHSVVVTPCQTTKGVSSRTVIVT
jgi:hypothetical protein